MSAGHISSKLVQVALMLQPHVFYITVIVVLRTRNKMFTLLELHLGLCRLIKLSQLDGKKMSALNALQI